MWSGWAELFECFEQDILTTIGPHPGAGWSLDRIDPEGDYVPGNVRWATVLDQRHNRRSGAVDRTPSPTPIGQVFGCWTVVAEGPRGRHQHRQVICVCACGTQRVVALSNLRAGLTSSCGCLRQAQ